MPAGSISPKAAGWKLEANSRAKSTLCLPVLPLGQHLGQDMVLEELLTLASRTLLILLPEESELPCLPYPAVWTSVAGPLTHLGIPPEGLGWEASLHLLWLFSAHFCKSRCTCAQSSVQFADPPSTSENHSLQGAWVGEEQKTVKLRNFYASCALQCLSVESIFLSFSCLN